MVAGSRALLLVVFCSVLVSCSDAHDVDALGGGTVGSPGGDEGEDTGGGAGASSTDGRTQTGSGSDTDPGGEEPSSPSGSGSSGSNTGSGSSSGGSSSGSGSQPMAPSGFPFPGSGSGAGPSSGGANVSQCSPCEGTMGIAGALEPCCTDAGECGVDLGGLTGTPACLQQNAPGQLDTSCPELDVMGMFQIPGCCMPSGTCGVMIRMLAPLGCVDPDELGGFLGGGGGGGGPTARCRP